ncbi:hypothetical protein PVAND_004660 [Polypedilum vanderplanki]|uniref:Glucuronosyltransferase n=1 Tax=Polypedilum vanderplanki TaxID=319348 RepID=A0A9J6BXT3_POLVA|nr:hypothetical protein PVAND_004660 [Polypedilum vanderplanki]
MLPIKFIAISLMMMSSVITAFDILILAPFPYHSNWLYMENFIEALLKRGHYLTTISPFLYKRNPDVENLKQIIISRYPIEKEYSSKDVFTGGFDSDIKYIQTQYKIGLHLSEHALNDSAVKKFIKKRENKFDVILADNSHQESLFMFAHKFNCPLITVDINSHSSNMDEVMGILTQPSFVPHPATKYGKEMTFIQRSYNTLLYFYETAVRRFSYMPAQNKLARKYFKDAFDGEIPDLSVVQKRISVILSNTHRLTNTRPKMAAQVDIAGAHLKEKYDALPAYLHNAIENSKHSIVFFSFGSYINSGEMPKEKINQILEAFRNTKKTIFWKFDGDIPEGVPENVIIQNWFPQNELLSNPVVTLFITSGSSLSFQEAIYHRIPMLIIPLTGEQYRNGLEAEKNGYGKILMFDDINEKTLAEAIVEITTDKSYFSNVNTAYSKFTDNPIEPMKEAIYWIQHVAKFGGLEKSPSVNYSWFTYYNLDVAAFYFLIFIIVVIFWIVTIKLILNRYRKREERGKFKYY